MTFDDLYMNNKAWEDETLIIIVDVATTYEMEVLMPILNFKIVKWRVFFVTWYY